MTSANPPYPYFNGITYNSQYFVSSSGSGLTQTQANALYLRKTTADTATALETFSSGIVTNGINPTTTTGTVTIGTSSTFTDLKGAVKASNGFQTPSLDPVLGGGNFNIGNGTASTINVGTSSATAVNIGSSGALTTTNGALTATGLITANNGLTMGTGKNITLQPTTSYVAPSSNTQLGYTIATYLTTAVAITSLYYNASLLSLTLPIGVWACCYCVNAGGQFQQTGTITRFDTQMNMPSSTEGTPVNFGVSNNKSSQSVAFGIDVQSNGSAVITNATSQTLSLVVTIGFTSTNSQMTIVTSPTTPYVYLTATRIA